MRLWLLIILVMFVQEIASTNVVLLEAVHAHYNPFIIHAIFLIGTATDLAVGYWIGKYVKRKFAHKKIVARGEQFARRVEAQAGRWGERVVLFLMGTVNYVYLNAFLAAWLTKRPKESLGLLFLGNAAWYALEWLLVLGVKSVSSDFTTELYILLGLSVCAIVLWRVGARIFSSFSFTDGGRG